MNSSPDKKVRVKFSPLPREKFLERLKRIISRKHRKHEFIRFSINGKAIVIKRNVWINISVPYLALAKKVPQEWNYQYEYFDLLEAVSAEREINEILDSFIQI